MTATHMNPSAAELERALQTACLMVRPHAITALKQATTPEDVQRIVRWLGGALVDEAMHALIGERSSALMCGAREPAAAGGATKMEGKVR
jgi:hypothetical protein